MATSKMNSEDKRLTNKDRLKISKMKCKVLLLNSKQKLKLFQVKPVFSKEKTNLIARHSKSKKNKSDLFKIE